jgi:hypothetical protein
MSPYLRGHISRFGGYATDYLNRQPEAFNPVLKEVDFTACGAPDFRVCPGRRVNAWTDRPCGIYGGGSSGRPADASPGGRSLAWVVTGGQAGHAGRTLAHPPGRTCQPPLSLP